MLEEMHGGLAGLAGAGLSWPWAWLRCAASCLRSAAVCWCRGACSSRRTLGGPRRLRIVCRKHAPQRPTTPR